MNKKGINKGKENICFNCKNACCGCSWSQFFIPVKGWTATKTTLKVNDIKTISTYNITACPLFELSQKPSPTDIKRKIASELGIKRLASLNILEIIRYLYKADRLDLYEEYEKAVFTYADVEELDENGNNKYEQEYAERTQAVKRILQKLYDKEIKKYYQTHKEERKEYSKEYYKTHKEKIRGYQKKYLFKKALKQLEEYNEKKGEKNNETRTTSFSAF